MPPITFGDPISVTALDFGPTFGRMVDFDSAARTLTLGRDELDDDVPGASSDNLFGCAWVGNAIPFGNGIRAYFRFVIREEGEGFVFALIDADRNVDPAVSPLCGLGGQRLGYAGGILSPSGPADLIAFPKTGVEFDTNGQGTRNDIDDSHLALLYWGDGLDNSGTLIPDDDNVHGAPPPPQTANVDPRNPLPIANPNVDNEDQFRHVRVEIAPSAPYDPATGLGFYTVRLWVSFNNNAAPPPGMDDTAVPYLAPTSTAQVFEITYLPPGSSAVMQNVRLGFTNGAGARDQQIEITNFEARRIP